jgi:hypothetical protein
VEPNPKAAEYRREAAKADEHAGAAIAEADRKFYSALAKRWRDMAEQAETTGL